MKMNDFFCGCGGMGLGFKQAGYEIVGSWDFDKHAVESYAKNVDKNVKQSDITKMKGEGKVFKKKGQIDVPFAHVWTFGFPCQDLSKNGKMAGLFAGKRSGLFFEVMRLLDEIKSSRPNELPKVIMAENVTGVKKYLDDIQKEYAKRGYIMYTTLYNSRFWGVPQNRERYFIVGVHESIKKEFKFLKQQTNYTPPLTSILEKEVSSSFYLRKRKADVIIGLESEGLKVRQATKKGYDFAKKGDAINISHPKSKTRRGRVGKQVSQTLLTSREQVVVLGDWKVRYMTPREFARLQGFGDDFEIVVTDNQAYKQFGNAVTVNVAKILARTIKNFLKDEI